MFYEFLKNIAGPNSVMRLCFISKNFCIMYVYVRKLLNKKDKFKQKSMFSRILKKFNDFQHVYCCFHGDYLF